jgi:branched-chain amino acid transport system ATP-binding protein
MGLGVQDVSVSFGGLAALSHVSLEVADGMITGLIGPNGAGKTTLFNVITGMQRPAEGNVLLDGRNLGGLPPHRRSRLGVGRTFQRLELFGTLTVRANVAVAASMARRWSGLGRGGAQRLADEVIERLGLRAVAEVRADALPTGTGRLVELARSLAIHPRVLLLDEPASGLSADETVRFASLLRSLAEEGLAVLLVEHDMDLVMSVCPQVCVLDYGKVICSGDPARVQADPAVRRAYLGSTVELSHG